MTNNTYTSLCAEYYILGEPAPEQQTLEFYENYACQAKGPILEPMCVTGRYLIPLMKSGFDIYGTDGSIHMLNTLRDICESQNLVPQVRQELLQDLDQKETYHLVIIPEGSIALILDIDVLKHSISKIWDSLVKDGLFVFELQLYYPRNMQDVTIYERSDGKQLLCSWSYSTVNYVRNIIARYELVENHQIIQTEIEWERVKYYNQEEI